MLAGLLALAGPALAAPPRQDELSTVEQDELPTVGMTAAWDGWEVTLHAYGIPSGGSASVPAPGWTQVLAAFTVTDLQNRGSACTEDIVIESGEGELYLPVTIDQTPGPPRVVRAADLPTPDPSTQRRYCITDAVFEVDATASSLTLSVLGIAFVLPL